MLDTFFVSAPEGASWPLDIDTAQQRLQERFPGMHGWIRHAPVLARDYLDFDVQIDGDSRAGAYYAGGPLILKDGDERDWAATIAWFLSLLPPGTRAVAMRESNPEQITALPTDPSAARIQQTFESLAAE